jgi:hypothetical protein
MKRSIATKTLALACAAAAAGCTPHSKTYLYTPHYDVQATGEDPDVPSVEARRLLATAKVIGFYPPDRCVNTTDKAEEEKQFRASCGTVLTELETAAQKAGYEVETWVNLRSTDNRRAIDYAREAKVDVLFEINEMTVDKIQADANIDRTLSFSDRTDHGDVSFNPSPGLAQRCFGWSKTHDSLPSFGDIATIDIKAVSVADGRARWHYKKSKVNRRDAAPASERFVGKTEPNKAGNTLAGVGGGLILGSALIAFLDAEIAGAPDPVTGVPGEKVFGSAPYYGIGIGVAMVAGGIALLATQGQKVPAADDVMCLDAHVPANGLYEGGEGPQPSVVQTGAGGGKVTFSENRTQQSTVDKATQEKELRESVHEFVQVLADVRQNPPPMPASPAPAPTQP